MRIAAYISGHGFGHLAQCAPILNELFKQSPESRFLIRCSLPEAELRARLGFDFELDGDPVDIGVIQRSAIEEDVDTSIARMRDWIAMLDQRIAHEIGLLKQFRPDVVLSNVSPLAFPAARAAGVPSVAVATLDWYTIYAHWLDADDPLIVALRQSYAVCDLLLTPPMAMDMQPFANRQTIPLIAANPVSVAFDFKPGYRRRALVIFGGAGQPPFDMQALARMEEWLFLMPGVPDDAPENVQQVAFDAALRAVDLMPHVDAVVCKPGYGILAECWRTGTPIAWVERPDFPEYPMLKRWLDGSFPSCGMAIGDFRAGNWLPALQGAITSDRHFPGLNEEGAVIATKAIVSFVGERGAVTAG